ncbi:GIY-YIG nuclease family protein [Patescibacteria group bacterium]|nr:GIY-YIG nuclease family protein [Patescibacteria group bacterium]
MYKVYILFSQSLKKHYIGHAKSLTKRLLRHNRGLVKSTKSGVPWAIIHVEEFKTKSEAYKRELQIKSYKGGEAFKRLIKK